MELLIFILAIIAIGYYGVPLVVWFLFIGIYGAVFFDINGFVWLIFAVTAVVFIIDEIRQNLITKKYLSFYKS